MAYPPLYPLPSCTCSMCQATYKTSKLTAPATPDSGFVSPMSLYAEQQHVLMLERSCIQTLVDLQQRKKVIGCVPPSDLPAKPRPQPVPIPFSQPAHQPAPQPTPQHTSQPMSQPVPQPIPIRQPIPRARVQPGLSSSFAMIDLARSRALRQTLIEINPHALPPAAQPRQTLVARATLKTSMKPPKQVLRKFLLARNPPSNSLARTFENPEIACHLRDKLPTVAEHSGAEVSLSAELKRLADMVAKRNLAMRTDV